jgi:hypothetical protein
VVTEGNLRQVFVWLVTRHYCQPYLYRKTIEAGLGLAGNKFTIISLTYTRKIVVTDGTLRQVLP